MTNTRRFRSRLVIAGILLVCCVGCDQTTKGVATATLKDKPVQTFLADTVWLGYAQNPGGFLSLGADIPDDVRILLFVGFNLAIVTSMAVTLFVRRNLSLSAFLAVVLIFAGGVGNLIDRVWNDGRVVDFINLGIGPVRTGIFNVADVVLMLGGGILIGRSVFGRRGHDQSLPAPPAAPDKQPDSATLQ